MLFKAVNKELIQLYWDIGKSIVTKQDRLGWGKSIVETNGKRFAKRISGNTRIFQRQSLENAKFLHYLSRK